MARHTATELVAGRTRLEAPPDTEWGRTTEGMEEYRSGDLRTGLNLVHHGQDLDNEERILRWGAEVIEMKSSSRTLISVFLMTCLKRTSFYPSEGLSQDQELYIAGNYLTEP